MSEDRPDAEAEPPLRAERPEDAAAARDQPDHANSKIHPPVLFVVCIASAALLHIFFSFRLPLPEGLSNSMGLILIALAVFLGGAAAGLFLRSGEGLPPSTPTNQVFETGPYRFTRNPIYLAMAMILLGLFLMSRSAWLLAATFIFTYLIQNMVIRKEEAYLTRKFKDAYKDYQRRVRRWI
ncbi:MAG: isoprenylcysteine carboxylmethyltransferase family protein [Pseudomonadota bacterium]